MKKLSILLTAAVLAFASCSKNDDDNNTDTTNANFKGSYSLSIDGKELNTLINDVMYITDYNRVEIYGMDANEEIITVYISNIPENNNETVDATIDGAVTLTYESILYSSMNGSGTITRLSSDKIKFDNIVVKTILNDASKTFSGTATIGVTKSL